MITVNLVSSSRDGILPRAGEADADDDAIQGGTRTSPKTGGMWAAPTAPGSTGTSPQNKGALRPRRRKDCDHNACASTPQSIRNENEPTRTRPTDCGHGDGCAGTPQSNQSSDGLAHRRLGSGHDIRASTSSSSQGSGSSSEGSGGRREHQHEKGGSHRVLASDTVLIDIVGPGWHGASEIAQRTQATGADFPRKDDASTTAGFVRNVVGGEGDGWGALSGIGTGEGEDGRREAERAKEEGENKTEGVEGVLKIAIVSNTLEEHSQNKAFEKLCRLLPRLK